MATPRKPLYGRRKGRPLRPAQQAALEKLLPRVSLDLGALYLERQGLKRFAGAKNSPETPRP